jgi:uncharacterized protein YuzE
MSDQYYTLEEVMRKLNKSKSTVIRETNAGKIPSEGKKRNRHYPKEAIDALVAIEENKRKKKKEPELVFSPSTPNDLWQTVAIGREQPYGDDDTVSYKTLLEWREINDEIFLSLKNNGKVVGYSTLMPLEEEVIISLIKDEVREKDIPLNAIKQWSNPNISVYVATIAVKPSGDKKQDSGRAGTVIKNTIKWALKLDRQADIKNWYSIGATKEGQNLLEELGFEEIVSLYGGERKGYYLEDIKKPVRLVSILLKRMASQ